MSTVNIVVYLVSELVFHCNNFHPSQLEVTSLQWLEINYDRKSFIAMVHCRHSLTLSRGLYYKTFIAVIYGFFVSSKSVCLWQAFPAKSDVFGYGQSLPKWSTFLHSLIT